MLIILIPNRTFIPLGQMSGTSKGEPKVVSHSLPLRMTHRTPEIRPAMTAIAAVLAFSSTQLLAQNAPEVTTPVTESPATAVPESAPTSTAIEPSPIITSDPIPTSAARTTAKSSKSTTTPRTATVARPAKAVAQVARSSVAAPVAAPTPTVASAPTPIVSILADKPAIAATPPAQNESIASSDLLPIAGAAGLGLLGLIGVGVAMRRRKRRNEEEFAAANQYEPAVGAPVPAGDPIAAEVPSEPRSVEPASAFVLGAVPAASAPAGNCAEAAPGSHVEAACDGPTPDNPSLSIKKRLKRAHFFDQREFLAAAGEVTPMAADAGLPDAVAVPTKPIGEPT